MKSFKNYLKEAFASPENHPLHSAAISNAFTHQRSSSGIGATTHEYSHSNGHSLNLLTSSSGQHSFSLMTKSGKNYKGNTQHQFMGATLGMH